MSTDITCSKRQTVSGNKAQGKLFSSWKDKLCPRKGESIFLHILCLLPLKYSRNSWNPVKIGHILSHGSFRPIVCEGKYWLFLPKHKLELMFSSIEPYAPRRCYLPGNLFHALRTTNTYSYHPLFLPANEKIACTCSQTASQSDLHSLSTFMLEIPVDLHLQFSQAAGLKRLFHHPPSTVLSYLYRCLSLIESRFAGR